LLADFGDIRRAKVRGGKLAGEVGANGLTRRAKMAHLGAWTAKRRGHFDFRRLWRGRRFLQARARGGKGGNELLLRPNPIALQVEVHLGRRILVRDSWKRLERDAAMRCLPHDGLDGIGLEMKTAAVSLGQPSRATAAFGSSNGFGDGHGEVLDFVFAK